MGCLPDSRPVDGRLVATQAVLTPATAPVRAAAMATRRTIFTLILPTKRWRASGRNAKAPEARQVPTPARCSFELPLQASTASHISDGSEDNVVRTAGQLG